MLAYLKMFAFPGLESDDTDTWQLAATVVCEMFASLSLLEGVERRPRLLKCYKTAESSTFDGGRDEELSKPYCSGDAGACYTRRRQKIFRTFLIMILKKAIQRRLPDNFFSRRCFTRSVLRVAPTDIVNGFNDVKVSFFEIDHNEDSNIVKKIKKNVVDKKLQSSDDDTGKRTIIIESQEQIDSLKILIGLFG